MATWSQWVEGARPRTLPAAIAPVAAGTGAAWQLGAHEPVRAILALVVSLALQVGVNYANDYSDGVRGTDDVRVGPLRLTASGAAAPGRVKVAAFSAFGVACVAGAVLVALCGAWWLLAVGVACVLAAWYYTGGRRPYGYAGLGEVFVFVFFGLVAVLGTTYTQAGRISWESGAAAVGIGLLACAILVANNLRDVPTDAVAGKHTLAVRLGETRTRTLYAVMIVAGVAVGPVVAAALGTAEALIGLLAFGLAWRPLRVVLSGAEGRALLPVLRDTGRTELALGLLLGLGLALGAA
jgi:1,4-dihydroxy-2-naphthoate octaprenyltransferase